MNSKFWVDKLTLQPHPEGGFFKEVYRSTEIINQKALPERFAGNRAISTSIYYLLNEGDFSAFHRIKSDEIWHFYDGDLLEIFVINLDGKLEIKRLHNKLEDSLPTQIIPEGCWFAARPVGNFTLAGCTVAPGFDFADFEMADPEKLILEYPQYEGIINQFSRT